MNEYDERLERLKHTLACRGLNGAVVGATDHMRYLVGWAEPPGERMMVLVVMPNGRFFLLVPSLYEDDARSRTRGLPVMAWHDNAGWATPIQEGLGGSWSGGCIAVDDELAAGHLLALQALFPNVTWAPLGPIMAQIRGVKSDVEIQRMERSAQLADAVFATIVTELNVGMTEAEVQRRIVDEFAARGALSSWAIVCFGSNTALPHHSSGSRPLQKGDLVILDLGCCLDGYQSDITRTGSFGPPPTEASAVYEIVHEAHLAAMRAAVPGATCESVDAVARDVIARNGYGDRFIHRTGHGIGMTTHEPPNLVAGDKTVLVPGMCFSDEPGIYLTGRFGVRIENIITVTAEGARSLNAAAPATLQDWSVSGLQ